MLELDYKNNNATRFWLRSYSWSIMLTIWRWQAIKHLGSTRPSSRQIWWIVSLRRSSSIPIGCGQSGDRYLPKMLTASRSIPAAWHCKLTTYHYIFHAMLRKMVNFRGKTLSRGIAKLMHTLWHLYKNANFHSNAKKSQKIYKECLTKKC